MNRNTESHFSLLPSINIGRSTFDRSSSVKTTFNAGDVIPFYVEEVLPGDTFNVKTSKVVRMQTLLTPVMDNVYLDTYYFFVPNRLVWDHWKEFCGENTESAWIPQTEYIIPQITSPISEDGNDGWAVGTIADYMGVPTMVPGLSVNALPFRAYALIMNEWFRDQNLTDPLVIPTDDSTVVGAGSHDQEVENYIVDVAKGGKPFKAAKYHDYFTSALPAPQKGPDVLLPVSEGSKFPVMSLNEVHDSSQYGMFFSNAAHTTSQLATGTLNMGSTSGSTTVSLNRGATPESTTETTTAGILSPDNLWAVDTDPVSTTINQLRLAFQVQKFYEKQARGGSRYTEVVRSFFGVISPDARLQRPEYLGGNRIPITINQVIQQSGTVDSSVSTSTPQGTVTGMSLTTDNHSDFVKSFTEHGYIIGVMVARYDHTYQQGLNRMWSRKDKFDFYWPVFANIGEQAIKNKEIFAQGTAKDNEVFGYQEAWAEYRYKPNIVTGEMRSSSDPDISYKSLDVWHLADNYSTLPSLSDEWIREDSKNIDRVLAVSSEVSNQFFADIYIQNKCTRPMPLYSIPGLVDHH